MVKCVGKMLSLTCKTKLVLECPIGALRYRCLIIMARWRERLVVGISRLQWTSFIQADKCMLPTLNNRNLNE